MSSEGKEKKSAPDVGAVAPLAVDKPKDKDGGCPVNCYTAFFVKFCKFMDGMKGRDKFSKIVQYGARAVKYHLLLADPKSDWGLRFEGLYTTTATGRKLFRVAKSLNELETLRNALAKGNEGDPAKFYLTIVKQFAFMWYWFFDNIGYFVRAKFLKYDKKEVGIVGSYGWTVGSLCGLLIAALEFQKVQNKILKKAKAAKESSGKEKEDLKSEIRALLSKRVKCVEDLVRYWLDVVVAGTSAELPAALGLATPNDGVIGVMGALSVAINGYQIWRETK